MISKGALIRCLRSPNQRIESEPRALGNPPRVSLFKGWYYVETNYFGGPGSQAAALFAGGKMVLKKWIPISRRPPVPDDPINEALRAICVRASVVQDELDTLGLGRFRDLEALGLDEWADDED